MSDRVLVPLPDGRWLALDSDAFEAALIAGTAAMTASAAQRAGVQPGAKLMSAEEMESATGVPASWYATQARERRIPFRKIGRYVRFDYSELVASEAFQRRAIPSGQLNCTGHRDRRLGASV